MGENGKRPILDGSTVVAARHKSPTDARPINARANALHNLPQGVHIAGPGR